MTLIEAARTMLADSLLPIPFWAEAVNTACYVLNRVLVTKPQNKTPYELLIGNSPSISFMRPFRCPLTILNTLDSLGKFDGKSDEGYLLGYSTSSKAFRVYNKRTKRVEENLHINFLKDQPNVTGTGPNWMFDLDFLTNSMNYIPVSVENQVNVDAGTQDSYVAGSSGKDKGPTQEYILLPLQPHRTRIPVEDVAPAAHEKPSESSPKDNDVQDSEDVADKEGQHQMTEDEQVLHDELEKMIAQEVVAKALDDATRQAFEEEKRNIASQKRAAQTTSINKLSTGRSSVSTATTPYVSAASTPTGANAGESSFVYLGGKIPIDASTLPNADLPIDPNMPDLEDDSDAFSSDGIFNGAYDDENVGAVADFNNMDDTINVSPIPTLRIHKDHPKDQILGDPKSAVQTRGKIQKASSAQQALVSYISKQNRTNHKDHQNCLLACFLSQEEPKNISQALQDESWVEAMQEELLQFKLQKVWILVDLPSRKKAIGTKWVIKDLYGLHQAPRAWYETLSSFLMENGHRRGTIDRTLFIKKKKSDIMLVQVYVNDIIFGSTKKSMCTEFEDCMHKRFQMSSIGELTLFLGLQVKQQPDGIFISQDNYVANILKKFDFWSIRTSTTLIESNKPLVKDEDGIDVDVHVYRSMIGSLMYLTASRPDIMFSVCACARYLKHQPKLGLWYPKDLPFELEAYSDSDYGGASLDRKSTTEYVADANCCGKYYVFLDKQLKNVPVPLDHFPINALTSKVFSFMVKKGKHFSGNVTPLFESMLVQPTEDEDQYETQPDPSPRPSPTIPDSIPEGSGGNHGGQSSSDRSLSGNKDGLTLQSVYDLCVSLCKQVTDQAKNIKPFKGLIKKIKKIAKNGERVSTEVEVSTVKPDEGTDKSKVSTDKPEVSTAKPKDGTSDESTAPTTVFRDDETIAEFLVSMSQMRLKQKPLPKIDPKDKGKKVLEEEAESEGVDEAERKFDQLAKDEEIARKVQGFKRKKEKHLQLKRAKFLYDIIAAQRRFLAQQRAIAIRSKPPTRTQLRNQMMTYLKHVGRKKHADLKKYKFCIKRKRVVIETPREEDTAKVPVEQEVTEQGTKKRKSGHVKMFSRKRPRPHPDWHVSDAMTLSNMS
ncbi:putative ribonuclease H-like domain-containing protein [Tanacetum coccineum]